MESGLHDDSQQRSKWRYYCGRQRILRGEISTQRSFRHINDEWHNAAECRDFSKLDEVRALTGELTEANYTKTLATLLKIEEAHDAISQRRYDLFKQVLRLENESVKIEVEGLSKGDPKLVINDQVILRNWHKIYAVTYVKEIMGDFIRLPGGSLKYEKFLNCRCDIFFVSRGLYSYYENAFKRFVTDPTMSSRLFDDQSVLAELNESNDGKSLVDCGTPEAEERFEALNEHQQKAVSSILEAKCGPKPYILFGPPGTGKTHTLAETIGQIYVRKPDHKILYCANSNTCVDQMVEKLKKIPLISPDDVRRLFAGEKPDRIYGKRIVLTTNMKSSTLINDFRFDYVIIDEAGHAHEPESLLPISCLKPTGCLVLAGDPKQLGPVVKCKQAEKYGLARSLLERIFDFRIYQRDRETRKYNSDYITKLLTSYRCDPRVLAISNELFYDGELECANETPKSLLKMMRITNPLQLCFVRGEETKLEHSTSRINELEADKCVDLIMRLYKMGVTPDQIGVISPYKLQSKVIREKLEEKLISSRNFLEERFRYHQLVERVRERAESESSVSDLKSGSDDSDIEAIMTELEKSKLGSEEQFDSNEQDEMVEKDAEVWDDAEAWEDAEVEEDAEVWEDAKVEEDAEVWEESVRIEKEWVEEVKERDDKWLCKIDSVDAYQGNEREIIIMSTVRTPNSGRKDFIDEPHRFNVALSRAKWLVFVLGHKEVLDNLSNWRKFVDRAGEEAKYWPKQSVFDLKHPYKQFEPLFKLLSPESSRKEAH